ncbi:hypothetical protein QWJ34_15900 [Saccharibacillus sp. CPCC 101409]|uniref:hypothetical protein n=1 Tax=Saccharibacillus sp. CPCC 101409 TaxID=3058041 RepID=UPI0026719809|nr:hypothetical protein [Saccharibacillus sp. CPCC 101409]MDO3411249.1 hypothetical protein [Saccharibacillus sp. CPCC 101409]
MDDRSAYGGYETDRRSYGMSRGYGYWDFLKYHLLLLALPTAVAVLLLTLTQMHNIMQLFNLFALTMQFLAGAGDEISQYQWIDALTGLFQLLAIGVLAGLVVRVIASGLFFLPGLALRGRMNLGTVMKTGLRYFFITFFIMLLFGFAIGIVNSILSAIPVLNVIFVVLAVYLQSMLSVYYDYWFSYNQAAGRPIASGPAERFRVLFGSDRHFLLYALLLALSYTLLVSIFVKPYIQLKIAQRMGM